METLSQTFAVRLSPTMRRQLEAMARADDRKPAGMVRRLIRLAWLDYERSGSLRMAGQSKERTDGDR